MPDFAQFSITARPDSNILVAVIRVQARVIDSTTGAVLNDFTGGNSIDFALRVPGFSAADHKELAERIATFIIHRRAGID